MYVVAFNFLQISKSRCDFVESRLSVEERIHFVSKLNIFFQYPLALILTLKVALKVIE